MTRIIPVTAVATILANAGGSCLSNNEPAAIRKSHALSSAISTPTAPARRNVMRSAILGLAAVMSLCTGPVAQAGTATGTLPVSMTITASCTIGATAMAFTEIGRAHV